MVVLDEPTAHLDEDTADAVLADLLAATRDRAVLVITHGDTHQRIGPEFSIDTAGSGPARWRPVTTDTRERPA